MQKKKLYWVLAYYHFTNIEDPHELVAAHKAFFADKEISSRIYISHQGINGQMSGSQEAAETYMHWLRSYPLFSSVVFKIHEHHENVFPRKTVKYRPQLVAIDEEIAVQDGGQHVSPKEWRALLESDERPLLLDVRNHYEWEVGRFAGAECPPCETFRAFKDYADELRKRVDPETTPVMMYCTGGIRCELYSALLKKGGFQNVYQLDGGVIGYGLHEGSSHWLGKLFVFDDRLTVPISSEESPVIGTCAHCGCQADTYYNCANMECNFLFISCKQCSDAFAGCCCKECQTSPRVRPYHKEEAHKPFRKKHHYAI